MRARWVREDPPSTSHIGFAVVARWFPGRYYLVSTIRCDGTSHLAKLTRSAETSIPLEQISSARETFVTNIFKCDRNGFVRSFENPLHERVYSSLDEAHAGHAKTVDLLAKGKLTLVPLNRSSDR